ncbi:MAG: lactate permease LctP family transporter [Bryobacteraceae bacterium]|nr:lactate permease LctP family transporter [Bryobacteraceae bacterium]
MWQQSYSPVADNLILSALVAALPIATLLYLLGIRRKPAWMAAVAGLATGVFVALAVYRMPFAPMASSVLYGAAFGLFPIGWIVFWAIILYRLTLVTGRFEILKDSIGSLTDDRRLQALLIAFAFGAFIEGAAGFGTPVAVAAAMLAGLGFSPFYAAGICLLANTAPVAFGSIGIPVITLQGITGLPLQELSAWVGRICAPVSLFVPAYLIFVMGGWRAMVGVWPAVLGCGAAFAGAQYYVSNFIGPQLVDIVSSLSAIGAMILITLLWKPKDEFHLAGESTVRPVLKKHAPGDIAIAWAPYFLLVVFVLLWGPDAFGLELNKLTIRINWPGLHNLVERVPPVVAQASPYAAVYNLNYLAASGTACMFAAFCAALVLRVSFAQLADVFKTTCKQLALSMLTIASVLGLAFLMNYCGATGTLGLALAATGALFPFFSAILGWLGVFLTGSDTSANALFGNLQVVTANRLGLDPVLMAASNSSGGVMGKMISLQSIAVAAAATGMKPEDESKLFRFTLRHSVILASVIGLVVVVYAAMQAK